MVKRIGMTILRFTVGLTIAGICGHLFGAHIFMLFLFGIAITGALFHAIRKWQVETTLAAIGDTDERPVRFDGTPAQGQLAIKIAKSEGWVAEPLPQNHPKKTSIRFTPEEGGSPARNLVRAFFEAGLAWKARS